MKSLFCYLKKYRKECVLAPLFKLLEALFELFVPLVVAYIIDTAIPSGLRGKIAGSFGIMVALGLVGLLCSVTAQWFAAKAAVGFSTALRSALFSHINTLSYKELDTLGTSTLITRMTSDINQLQAGINLTLRLLLRSPVIVFGAMIMAFTIDIASALVFVVAIPLLAAVVFGVMLFTVPRHKKVQGILDDVTGATRENLTGVRVIRAFCRENNEVNTYQGLTALLCRAQKAVGFISGAMNPITYIMINAAVIVLLHLGAGRVNRGLLTTGQVVALYNYMSQILVELIKMANVIVNMTKAVACSNRISAAFAVKNTLVSGSIPAENIGAVEFKNVSLRYAGGGADSLEHISFSVKPGQTVGIIGGTGSGKTTLVNLIPRFYDVTAGQILLGGKEIKNFDVASLRRKISVVPQKAVLFRGTVRENLCFGADVSDSELLAAIKAAQANDVLLHKQGGLDAEVEQDGRNFSGGQRQRLTIARALAQKGEILILDDSASALDFATDAALRKGLDALPFHPTVFIISQRTSSIRHADLILVLDDGRLVGSGTHESLLGSCGVYREIYESQFRKEGGKS